MKKALITGATGQDGSYLIELLLKEGYEVHGMKRYTSNINTPRLDKLFNQPNFKLHHGDLCDQSSIDNLMQEIQPDEVYNLGALSHVKVSFGQPLHTFDVNALGPLRILESIRKFGLQAKTKFYQASTSEMYGKVQAVPQTEDTPFYPRSPYGIAKLASYWSTVNYREAYGIFACNGILFNHESPVRGETFVTRKVTRGIAALLMGHIDCIKIGNLDAQRDWGHARDYVQAMYLMLQKQQPGDYVIATGKTITVREMIAMVFRAIGIEICFYDKDEKEYALIEKIEDGTLADVFTGCGIHPPEGFKSLSILYGKRIIRVDPQYYRPAEVDLLVGDASKAQKELGWTPICSIKTMLSEMIEHDLHLIQKYGYNG